MLTAAGEKLRTRHLRSESASSPRVFGNFGVDQQSRTRRAIVLARANAALKLTVRRCFSRRPSRLPVSNLHGVAPLAQAILYAPQAARRSKQVRRWRTCSLTSRRWDDTESHVASSSPDRIVLSSLSGTLPSLFESHRVSQSHPETLKSHCRSRGVDQFTMLRSASLLLANTSQFTAAPAGVHRVCRAQSANVTA